MTPAQLRALFEERQTAANELRSLYDTADGRDLTADERSAEDRLNGALTDLAARIDGGLAAAEAEQRADEARARFDAIEARTRTEGQPEQRQSGPSDEERFMAVLRGEARAAEFGPPEARTLTAGTATDGAELVPKTLYNQLIEHLVEASPILRSGVRIVRTSSGEELTVPRTTSYSSASIVAEAAQIGASDPQFGTVVLGAYKYGFLVQTSRELIEDSAFNAVEFVGRQGAAALGRGIDAHLATGSGSGQPAGIDTCTKGVDLAATNAVTGDEVIDLYYSLIEPYRVRGVWWMDDTVAKAIRKLKGSDGQYLWQTGLQAGVPDTLLGRPVFVDPELDALATAKKVMVFGDPMGYMARLVGGMRVERSDEFAFDYDLVTFRFLMRADGDIVDTNALRHALTA